jgi:hypothetical protein
VEHGLLPAVMACVAARTDDEHGVSAYLKLFCKKRAIL